MLELNFEYENLSAVKSHAQASWKSEIRRENASLKGSLRDIPFKKFIQVRDHFYPTVFKYHRPIPLHSMFLSVPGQR